MTAGMIAGLPKLKMIHSEGVGFNAIDLEAARSAGVYVCNNRGVNAAQVAEHAVLLILSVLRRFAEGEMMVYANRQNEAKGMFISQGLGDLIGKRVGLIGFGAIGKELAKRLAPFGCEVVYYDPFPAGAELEAEYGVKLVDMEELYRESDIITLHVHVTPETEGMINADTLAKMKKNAILINVARGAVVKSGDLAEAICNGVIYGAGLDVLDPEPFDPNDPILNLPEDKRWRLAVSPHIAGTTVSVFAASYVSFWANVKRLAAGEKPVNIVNGL